MFKYIVSGLLGLSISFSGMANANSYALNQVYAELVGTQGEIAFPADFQRNLVHLGTTAVMSESMRVQNLNGIYTQAAAVEAYNSTGKWPDGTLFVKDVKLVSSERLTTGLVYHQQANDVFFVMIKDTQGRFANNPHWGEGWGWAMFDATPTVNVSESRAQCQACHAPRRDNDWLYTDQYPALLN
ncbi:hypothetical protein OAG1_38310 [Agarivorans sp. OAG1]|uniref:cytochrome P460 family protein n=1 Tax=Agarivorans sp. OAG1 TaxID=3082387 RepID=UPI002B27CD81|nr:hypothetical protein OAG1_38310 [Agarivorans sp. OAG1]